MKPRSAKAKGRRLQQEIKQLLHKHFPDLDDEDIKVAIMGESGVDIHLSPAAQKLIPFSIECKNQQRINVWQAIDQAEGNTKNGRIPLVIFRRNRSKTYAIIEIDKLMELLYKSNSIKVEGKKDLDEKL